METRNMPQQLEHNKHFFSVGTAFGSRRPSYPRQKSKPEIFLRNKSFSFDAGNRNIGCDPHHFMGLKSYSTQNSPLVPEFGPLNVSQTSFSEKSRRFFQRKPRITVSCTREDPVGERTVKMHSKRDSVLSVISPALKNDEIKAVNEGHKEPDEFGPRESSSIRSHKSFPSNKSTLILSPLPTGTFSDTSNERSLSITRSSLNSSIASSIHSNDDFCGQDFSGTTNISPKRYHEQLHWQGEEEENGEKENPDKLICYSSMQTSSFQEQEYRIAKAWLEAEELRKAKCQVDGGLTGSISISGSSCKSQPWTIDVLSSNYKHVDKSASIKSPFFWSGGLGEFKDEDGLDEHGLDKNYKDDERGDYLNNIPGTESRESGTFEKKNNRKRLSAISNLSLGMRGWLSRRTSSH